MNRHSIEMNGKNENIDSEDLKAVAKRNDISNSQQLIDRVCSAVAMFRSYALDVDIDKRLIDQVEANFSDFKSY